MFPFSFTCLECSHAIIWKCIFVYGHTMLKTPVPPITEGVTRILCGSCSLPEKTYCLVWNLFKVKLRSNHVIIKCKIAKIAAKIAAKIRRFWSENLPKVSAVWCWRLILGRSCARDPIWLSAKTVRLWGDRWLIRARTARCYCYYLYSQPTLQLLLTKYLATTTA